MPVATPTLAELHAQQAALLAEVDSSYLKEQQLLHDIKVLVSQRSEATVNSAVLSYQITMMNQLNDFTLVVNNEAAKLGCDALCVNPCTASAPTIDAKSACLTTCNCFTAPQVLTAATPADAAQPQALFLGEEAFMAAPKGSSIGSAILSTLMVFAIIAGAAFLHVQKQGLRKASFQGGFVGKRTTKETVEGEASLMGEYLLLKS